MFSFLPYSMGQFQNSHAITLPLPTSSRKSNRILFLILPSGLLLPDLCLFCSSAKLQQMSCVLRMMGQTPYEFRWFCRFFGGDIFFLFFCIGLLQKFLLVDFLRSSARECIWFCSSRMVNVKIHFKAIRNFEHCIMRSFAYLSKKDQLSRNLWLNTVFTASML